jgi:hypothetical protein
VAQQQQGICCTLHMGLQGGISMLTRSAAVGVQRIAPRKTRLCRWQNPLSNRPNIGRSALAMQHSSPLRIACNVLNSKCCQSRPEVTHWRSREAGELCPRHYTRVSMTAQFYALSPAAVCASLVDIFIMPCIATIQGAVAMMAQSTVRLVSFQPGKLHRHVTLLLQGGCLTAVCRGRAACLALGCWPWHDCTLYVGHTIHT